MKSTVGVCLLFLVLLEAMCCEGCWKEERDALLVLNSRFDNAFSWDAPDCCHLEGVTCNSSTGRVAQLHLQWSWWAEEGTEVYINYSDFVVFKDLKNLDLSFNGISGCVGNGARLENLEVLDLRFNHLDAAGILSCLDGLSSLKSLYLKENRLNTSSFHVFETLSSKLRNLEVLDISNNYLTNDILPSLGGFTSLKVLNLAAIQLDSDLHIQGLCSSLRNLEVLHLSDNNFFNHTDIGYALSGLSSLKSLYLDSCQLTSRSIFNISKLSSLEILDLSYNNFNDRDIEFALGSKSLRRLDALYLDGNMIDGNKLRKSLPALSSVRTLSMSENEFKGTIVAGDFHDLSNLEYLTLDGSSNLENEFFKSIGELTSLKVLSFSNCDINGTLPPAVFSVAHNNLSGETPDFKGQFSTFDESSYEGNPFLCGPPLPKSCNPPPITIIPNDSNTDGENDSLVDMYVFCVSFAVSCTSTLLVTAAALYINSYWRRAWFYYMELVSMNCYYFIKDNLSKVFKIGNM